MSNFAWTGSTMDQMWLVIENTCELWGTGGLDRKIVIFWHFSHDSDIYLFFFVRQKLLNKGRNFFWRSSTTRTTTFRSWLTPPLHNLALSPRRSWFFKNSICRFLTLKSSLGILMLSDCHKILDAGSIWCWEATVQILSKSDKVKGGKSLPHRMK